MRRVVLKAILRVGRRAIRPVVALACAISMVWLMAIDRYRILALAAAPIGLACSVGRNCAWHVVLPFQRDQNLRVDEGTAPGLSQALRYFGA
jgi:hypothetical protein